MIEVLKTGPLNSVQDCGRTDYRHMGVSVSGVMDMMALMSGNIMLGNDRHAAAIEVQMYPFQIRFRQDTAIFITGTTSRACLDDTPLPSWWGCRVRRGQTLTLNFPQAGWRTYVCVAGGIQVPKVLNSRSTALRGAFGGLGGRCLSTGDQLPIRQLAATDAQFPPQLGIEPPDVALKDYFPVSDAGEPLLRAIPAGEYELFAEESDSFWSSPWEVSMQSDRTGYRLAGRPLTPSRVVEMRSYGLLPGIIQVPPSGEPIIQLSDANTAGGYPKIACVIEEDLWRIGQVLPGRTIQFIPSTNNEAMEVREAIEAWLCRLEQLASPIKQLAAEYFELDAGREQ